MTEDILIIWTSDSSMSCIGLWGILQIHPDRPCLPKLEGQSDMGINNMLYAHYLANSQSTAVLSNWFHPQAGQRVDVMCGELERGTDTA